MGPIWGHQGPGGPFVGPMNFAISVMIKPSLFQVPIWQDMCDKSLSEQGQIIADFM